MPLQRPRRPHTKARTAARALVVATVVLAAASALEVTVAPARVWWLALAVAALAALLAAAALTWRLTRR